MYSNGTVRVGGRDALHGTVPHTEQPGGCGEPGSRIQLDQAGLADRTGTEFLHHWARCDTDTMDNCTITIYSF